MDLHIQRTGNAFNIAFLEFIVPIIACYYLLGATLMLDPKKQLNERLVIYVALFVFVPTFLLAIQNYLPYRSSLSFPELLLTNLIIGNAIFGVFSIVGKRKGWSFSGVKRLKNFEIHHNNWDLVGVTLCLLFFMLIYVYTLFGKIALEASFIISYFIIPAYVIWFPFENIKKISIKKCSKSIKALFMGTTILTASFFIALFLDSLIVLLIGSIVAGLSVGLYLRKVAKSALLSLLSGVLGTMLTGTLAGLFFGQILFGTSGLSAVLTGIIFLGVWGYPVGGVAGICGLIGAFLIQSNTATTKSV